MRMFQYPLKAFTIVELLVVMLLSSLAISGGYFVLDAVQQQMHVFVGSNREVNNHAQLDMMLRDAFYHAVQITASDMEVQCSMKDNRRIGFIFYPDFVIHTQHAISDTFSVKAAHVKFQYKYRPVSSGGLLDNLEFVTGKRIFVYEKEYDAATGIAAALQQNEGQGRGVPENKYH